MPNESSELVTLLRQLIQQIEGVTKQNAGLTRQNQELAEVIKERLSIGPKGYSVKQVAKEIGLSAYTLRQMCPDLPGACKVPGRSAKGEWRISHDGFVELQKRYGPPTAGDDAKRLAT